ncbi:G2 and S phase-expressed protein 1 [Eublepharis macularius]|uniref:G2 and S phase-expressed protein 1 n=1 Tax=Eublepharis macularius TaxID=481883 RepID=A0AA97JT95_EUBMA|nr:G2 and S phase-expressed protein 1 [Eublepharis macularius]
MEEEKLVVHSECKMTDVKPDQCISDDFPHLSDEKFDFDLSLSPSSENDDEVFVGPMGHKEKCIAVAVEACEGAERNISPQAADDLMWSPLTGEKFVEIFKEAHMVALQLQSASKTKRPRAGQVEEQRTESVEKFVQESKSKLKIFEMGIKSERTPRAVKRETYCVCDSPVSQLLPSVQKHPLQLGRVKDSMNSPLTPQNISSPRTDKLPKSFSSPVLQIRGDKDNKKASKLQTVKTSFVLGNNLPVGQPEQERPEHRPGRKHLKSRGSLEDLLSSKSSTGSGDADSSLMEVKSALPTLGKLNIKTTQLKPPKDVQMRRSTLSSSSSSLSSMNSSFNSSLSISPKRGTVKTNIVAKASTRSSWVSSSTAKVAMVRPIRVSSSVQASRSGESGKQERSTCATKGHPSVNMPQYKAAFESKTSGSGMRGMGSDPRLQKSQKSILQNRRGGSCSETKMVPSTKEGTSSGNGMARVLQPIAVVSCGNVGSNVTSLPVKQPEEQTVLHSCSSIKSTLTPASLRRSGLPAPVSRVSGIPARTPKTVPRPVSSPNFLPVRQVSSALSKTTSAVCSKRAKESNMQTPHSSSVSSTEEDVFSSQAVSVALDFSPEKDPSPKQDFMENQKTADETQAKEGLLIDIGREKTPVTLQKCENKPLIDFFNSPEMIKVLPLKPKEQLVNLGSPLIYLSPEGNKENLDSPLLKF